MLIAAALMSVACVAGLYGCDRHHRLRETVLKSDLYMLRKAMDDFYQDRQRYPTSLGELVEAGYIRGIPVDPLARECDSWVEVKNEADAMVDVKSGAAGKARDGTEYASW